MYAIVEQGGKQYRVAEGDVLEVASLRAEPGERVSLGRVLLVGADDRVEVGAPALERATVTATVLGHGQGRKVTVVKYKPKKHYRRKVGHRQGYTRVRVDAISL